VRKEIIESYPDADLSIIMVWLPMVPGDGERAARRRARELRDPRVRHFYDPDKLVGLAFAEDVFGDCIGQALTALPNNHRLREHLEQWQGEPAARRVVWDAFFVYPQDFHWSDRVPKPARWAKQVEFFPGGGPGEPTGTFWADDCATTPYASDWHAEVRALAHQVLSRR